MSRGSVSVRERSNGHLANCRLVLQEIIWMIDNWENTIRSFHCSKKEEEIVLCENALVKVKDLIWTSCLTMFSKYDPQTREPRSAPCAFRNNLQGMTSNGAVSSNSEVFVCESNRIPMTVQHHEATQTVMRPHHQIVKNLLLEWSVFVNPQFKLCVMGTLPNGGKWETSPISARLGPTSVKTTSGTMYNMHGKMVVEEDEDIPDFVVEKFRDGFPVDWENVAGKWIRMLKVLRSPAENPELHNAEPRAEVNNSGKRQTLSANQVSQQKGESEVHLAKGNTKNPVSSSTERSSVIVPEQNQQKKSPDPEESHKRFKRDKSASKEVACMVPRFSQRLLSKSLIDTSGSSEQKASAKKIVNAVKCRWIKDWIVRLTKQPKLLVLCGSLIDEKGNVLEEYHTSSPIVRRVQRDVVDTDIGVRYRLVGPSISKSKVFDFGFPIQWQNLLEKLKDETYSRGPLTRSLSGHAQIGRKRFSNSGGSELDSLKSSNGAPAKKAKVSNAEKEGQGEEGKQEKSTAKAIKTMKPDSLHSSTMTNTDKYVLGLSSDECLSENNDRIF